MYEPCAQVYCVEKENNNGSGSKMDVVAVFSASGITALAVVVIGFLIAHFHSRRYDFIDTVWGVLFIAIAWVNVLLFSPHNLLSVLVAILVSLWGIRLARHILFRWLRSEKEDHRYVELRKNWPPQARALQVFVRIYLLQALLACVISLPVVLFVGSNSHFDRYVVIGVVVWAMGLAVEATADRQLRLFLAKPENKGGLMTGGVWAYSRHPNYFGEMLVWGGIGIVGLGQAYGPYGLIGPIVISLLLLFVSGVPLAEKAMANKPGWNEYRARTPLLIPWFKRR